MELAAITKSLQACSQTLMSFARIAILSKWTHKPFRTQNSECLVLANGPSLSKSVDEHIDKFESADFLCVNSFPLTEYFTKLKPRHYIFSAPEMWLEDVLPVYIELREGVFKNLEEKVDWDLNVFAPHSFKKNTKAIAQLKKNSNITITFYNTTPVEGIKSISNFLIKLGLGMPRPHNVVVPCLINLINSGYKNITLFGVDHSWLNELSVDDNNVALLNQKHFYDEKTSKSDVMRKKGKAGTSRTLAEILDKFVQTFRSYNYIDQYASKRKAKIWNATPNSFIDAFERKYP